ncbi:NADP-dependent oxidoreductase [Alysiella filiformis]|uniref:Alcohol dehydrogenase n=1 Tax=Alysiella filiformis DSM 16848 TaxID=1120981 RepID=A0A286EWM0_9NEIS|nr:NADP-dependent oxidoreductase [Alysiella filiformis]UBQ56927.1 NADP-dependent oxidoreductase [Alysiella filiformis DSM 16848]SOD75296.1 alcohol dehydrogenase [Alysiella filiformis DSM 16848]
MNLPTQMTAMTIQQYGKTPVQKQTVAMPMWGDDDVLVQVHSASINPLDFKIKNGDLKLILPFHFPLILGNDFAGVVAAVGKNVKNFAVGDEVFARTDTLRTGAFGQFIAIKAAHLAQKPSNLDFNESASLPLVALTAMQAFEKMGLKSGSKVLIHAGTGGLGGIAIQIAKILGLHVATTVSTANTAWVKTLGADEVIDYKKENFNEKLKDFDGVLDTLGGDTLLKSFEILKQGGKIISVAGMPTAQFADEWGLAWWKKMIFSLISAKIHKTARKYGASYEFLFMQPSGKRLESIKIWAEQGKLTPVIDQIFTFDNTQKALEYSESGRAKGKIIVKIQSVE